MHLHAARLGARRDAAGGLLLLEEQDRSLWDRARIRIGLAWLERSATGDVFSRFHAEAGIAAEHCFAPSFEETRWSQIADLYAMLERTAPSPLHTMNRAVAIAESQGPAAGLAVLEALAPPAWLAGSYLWTPSWAIYIGAQAIWRSHNDIATARLSPRRPMPCATSSGGAW
jgi:RNA polymerase sigma-70 factor (ECF subfamily)